MRPFSLLALCALTLLPADALAQDPLELELIRAPRRLDTVSVAIVAVHDLRGDTASIGEAQTGLTNKTRPVQLKGGASAELLRFLQTRLPVREGVRPVAIGLDLLMVSEQRTPFQEIARAEIELRFFEARGDSLGLLTSTRGYTERTGGMDVTHTHDENIRAVLVDAVKEAAADGALAREANEWGTLAEWRASGARFSAASPDAPALPDTSITGAVVASGTAVQAGTTTSERAAAVASELRTLRQHVTVGAMLGGTARGGTLAYGAWTGDPTANWLVPFSFSATFISVDDPDRGVSGFFTHTGGTLSLVRRLNPGGLGLQGSVQLIGGTETFEGSDDDSFFFGGRLGAGLAFYPPAKGVVAQAGVFGSRLFGSELYPSDVGFVTSVGYQF